MKKVLIADHNSTCLSELEGLLGNKGIAVTTTHNGREALADARRHPPDLVVTDTLMPVMDGFTLCWQWKSDDRLKAIPLVFYADVTTACRYEDFAHSLGADRFIVKPQHPSLLLDMLQEVWRDHQGNHHGISLSINDEGEFLRRHNEFLAGVLAENTRHLEQAQRHAESAEERYRLCFYNANDVFVLIDRKFTILSVSPSVEWRLGYRPDDFRGHPVADLAHILTPESLKQALSDIGTMFTGEKVPLSVYEFIAREGEHRFGEVGGSLIMRDGEIEGIICIIRDITDRRMVEDALTRSEEKFRKAFYTSPDAVSISRLEDGMFVSVNPGFTRLTGYTEDETIGRTAPACNIWDRIEDRERLVAALQRDGSVTDFEAAFRIKGDAIRYGLMSASIIDLNDVPHILNITRDVTDHRKAQDALRESENKYRLLADNAKDVIFVLDMALLFTYISPSVQTLLGYDPDEVLAQSTDDILTPDSRSVVMETFTEVMNNEQSGQKELSRTLQLHTVKKDGTTVPVEVKLSFIRDEHEEPVGILGVTRDISERVEAEERLKDTLKRLRKAVGATVQVMGTAVESRDPYTAGHQRRVADLARTIATEMGLPRDQIDAIRMAGAIHDIGKLSIPAELLAKPTKLTDTEFSLIKQHPEKGYDMLKNVESPWPLAEIIYQHHERMDGSGYPRQLKGEEILMEARILAVADVVEAMASHRPYRPTLGPEVALNEIISNRGTRYDADVVDACIRLFRIKGYRLG